MYWGSPDIDAAYHVPNEYMFGTELLAAPITEPMDKSSRRGKADVWLPQGDWFDFFTGRRYSASSPNGRRMTVWRPLDGIPVFAKAGGIVPMQPLSEGDSINSVDNPQHLEIIVFPGADGDFTLMEDSGHYSRRSPRDHRDHLSMAQGRRHIRTHGIASPGRRSRSAGPENMGFPVPRHYRQRHIRTGRRRIRRFGSPV